MKNTAVRYLPGTVGSFAPVWHAFGVPAAASVAPSAVLVRTRMTDVVAVGGVVVGGAVAGHTGDTTTNVKRTPSLKVDPSVSSPPV